MQLESYPTIVVLSTGFRGPIPSGRQIGMILSYACRSGSDKWGT